jgi:DNA-binding SARP family transcriptional activator/predicted ATPase
MRIEFRILGPLELSADGRLMPLGSPKQRALLALLLVHANETVSRDRLIEELWAEAAPASVESAFHVYLSRLRRVFESAGGGALLVRRAHGYRLRLEADQLDATRFQRLVSEGSEALAAGEAERAADRLRQGLALWRGPALADLESERFAISAAARLEEGRVSALEQRIEADLALARHRELVGELETLVVEHPYRERLRAQLMLALYRCGRQAEALQAYQHARRTLADELALEPGHELKELEQAILRQDPTLTLEPSAKAQTEPQRSPPPPASLPSPREERKIVTVLFADLVGFTAQAEPLDPEDVRTLQDRYWVPVRAEIERHGGTVEKFVGDAVMALFGAPQAHEDDPERAVRAALAIRDWAREQEQLEVRIAVTTGEALVRLGAQALAGEGIAAGDVINTAARLEAAAPVNGILVGDRTYRATTHLIDYRRVPPVRAKGKAEPIPAWEALEARSRLGVDLLQHARTRLVGRERELNVLTDALARVREERAPQLITLVGVPGIGKSRLVYELMQATANDPSGLVIWRQGRSLSYGDGVSFWALAEIVKAHAGIFETDPEQEARAKLARAVQILIDDVPEREWVGRHLGPLVGLGGEGGGSFELSEAFAAWRRFFEALADTRPAVLVFEDLHWADEGLLDFVDGLVEWVPSVPLLVVATARPELLERRPGWGGGKANAATLSLAPLSEDDTSALVHELVEGQLLPEQAEKALVAQAAGNALYAEQYVRMWQERGEGEQLPLPETVHGIIAARLDALSLAEKNLLQNAAVFGKVFWESSAVALDGIERGAAAESLHALERKEFILHARRSSVMGEREYAFRHVLVREVAYGQIPRSARADKHERAVAWIESLGRAEDHAETLAHHYLSTLELRRATGPVPEPLVARAALALILAGQRASAVNAFPPAAGYYEQALQLLPENDSRRPEVLLGYARALFASGDERRGAALEQAHLALLGAGDSDSAAEADTLLAEVAWYQGRRSAIDEHLQRSLTLTRDRGPSAAKARVLAAVARFRMLAEDPDAVEIAREALALAEALDLHEIQAQALITLGSARSLAGEIGGASDIERGLQIALEHNALAAAQRGYNNLASVSHREGDLTRRLDLWEQSEQLARRLGDTYALRFLGGQLIAEAVSRGQWDDALRQADEFIAECEAGSPHVLEARVRADRAEIRLARDDVQGALADHHKALALARQVEDLKVVLEALMFGVRLYARLGNLGKARRLADEAQSYDPDRAAKYVLMTLAWHKEQLGLSTDALAPYVADIRPDFYGGIAELILAGDFERLADLNGDLGRVAWEAEARQRAAEQLLQQGQPDQAEEQLRRALTFYRSVGATRYTREAEELLTVTSAAEEQRLV